MLIMSVTDFARNMNGGTALEVMADIYRTLPDAAGETWLDDSGKQNMNKEIRESVKHGKNRSTCLKTNPC